MGNTGTTPELVAETVGDDDWGLGGCGCDGI